VSGNLPGARNGKMTGKMSNIVLNPAGGKPNNNAGPTIPAMIIKDHI
jgi:hypothetical protein